MKKAIASGLIVCAVFWSTITQATSFDGSKQLLCASATAFECLRIEGCTQVAPEEIAAPTFMRFDFSKKTVSSIGTEGTVKTSGMERSESVDGKLILQGAEDGVEGVRDGLGWTIAISQDSGRMVLTGSGDDVAFTIFGSCTPM